MNSLAHASMIVFALSSLVACGEHATVAAPRSIARAPRATAASSTTPSRRKHFEARIVHFTPNALWFHYADHSFEVFDSAEIDLVRPEEMRGRRVAIHHPAGTTAESKWRVVGQQLEFDADDDLLSGSVQTFVGGLDHLRFVPATAP